MSTINVEVMKQLLQEFVDKEALALAEIEVVKQQIDELEHRIDTCRDRLKVVSEDKEKIAAMTLRYASDTDFLSAIDSNGHSGISKRPTLSSEAGTAGLVQSDAQKPVAGAQIGVDPSSKPLEKGMPGSHPETTVAKPADREAQGSSSGHPLFDAVAAAFSGDSQATESPEAGLPEAKEKPPQKKGKSPPSQATEPAKDDTVKNINDALRGLFR